MRNVSKFFIPSDCSDNVIHFNFNLVLFALVSRAPSGSSIIYATVNKAIIKHYKGKMRNKIAYMVQHTAILCQLKSECMNMSRPVRFIVDPHAKMFYRITFTNFFWLINKLNLKLIGICGCLLNNKYIVLERFRVNLFFLSRLSMSCN